MPDRSHYVVTLKSKVRFVAYTVDTEPEIPGMLRLHTVYVNRDILVQPTAIEAMTPCTEEEARMSGKALNGKSTFHRYFGETLIRMKF
ncbi:hypothetical protein [Lewinella sp. IMCC34191]|uniref:hypothetical protein n=1 Tax=Lewinella sp. IMCC34191 TaxID=2259172 RepID=UPI000E240106|nr:hypothetical protein [Lewinella sp. IMCC34191]